MKAAQTAPKLDALFRAKAQELRPLAVEYCAKKGIAEVLREQVDAIAKRVLADECPLYRDLEDGERVIEPKDYWLCEDEAALKAYYAAMDRELRAAGLKPDEMELDYCPALVAQNNAMEARRQIIRVMAPLVGIERNLLWGDKEDQFFELVMGLIFKA
jgi:hypothetical protein